MGHAGHVLIYAVVSLGEGNLIYPAVGSPGGKRNAQHTFGFPRGLVLHGGAVGLWHERLVHHVDDTISTQVRTDHLLTVHLEKRATITEMHGDC